MRLTQEIRLMIPHSVPDGFGGNKTSVTGGEVIAAIVSVKSNDLQAKPSGMGYYRQVTIAVNKGKVTTGDKIEHNGVVYNITRKVDYNHSFLDMFIGYEV